MSNDRNTLLRIRSDTTTCALKEILEAVADYGRTLNWSLLDLEAISAGKVLGKDMVELEESIARAPYGITIGWMDLMALLKVLKDIWSIRLVGKRDHTEVPKDTASEILFADYDFVVERFDSGDWTISCLQRDICQRIAVTLGTRHVIEVDASNNI